MAKAAKKSTTSATAAATCPVARLAAEYQIIHDIENESNLAGLDESDCGYTPMDMLRARQRAVEAMAGVLPAESVEGALFQLGLLFEIITNATRGKEDESIIDIRAACMAYSVSNFLRRKFDVPEGLNGGPQWLLPAHEDPFKINADLWAKVEFDRREESTKGGAP